MSILNFLKKIKLPSFDDEFIVDPVDQVSPEHGHRMQVLAAGHREKDARRLEDFEEDISEPLSLCNMSDISNPLSPYYVPEPGLTEEDPLH